MMKYFQPTFTTTPDPFSGWESPDSHVSGENGDSPIVVEMSPVSNTTELIVLDKLSLELITILIVSSVIGFVGNTLILFLIFGTSTFRKTTNYLIANLSVASLSFVCLGIFAIVYRNTMDSWPFGLIACKWYIFLKRLPVAIVSFTTIAINADRNHIVGNPLSLTSSQTICIQIIGIWSIASLIITPLGFSGSLKEFTTSTSGNEDPQISIHCIEAWTHRETQIVYGILIFLLVHFIPVTVMILGMWKMRTKMKFLLKSPNASSDRRVKLMRNSCIFTCIFISCWLPTGIFRLPLDLPRDFLPGQLRANIRYYTDLCGILGYFHTCVLPLLLFTLSHDLRKHLCLTANCCHRPDDEYEEPQAQPNPNDDEEENPHHESGDEQYHNQNDKSHQRIE